MSKATDTPQLVVRPRRVRRVAAIAAVAIVAVFGVVAALLRNTPTGVYFRVSDQVAMVGVGLLIAVGVLSLARPRLRAGAQGVEVRNILETKRVPWDLVLGVTFPEGAPWARLELPDDEYVAVMAIQAADGEHAVRAMRELRRLYRAATGGDD
ncbi:PH domain-containing protein [Gandjariella thermophila]|uniref:Membrane protein n=1 Tax=Gandjariella thermophila TaxID=1931992 RepID=A0A4D4J4L7_9PSEU|nr:PH domain-containing protein [Gandjariella thermophila]GDY28893.1 membrane protein [Gandjariella thermophila]